MGRGCSTKDKVFYRECETHSYGANLEKMCFCSFDNCNPAATMLLKYAAKSSNWYNISCLLIIIISGLLLTNYQCSTPLPFRFTNINSRKRSEILPSNGLNPWPDDKNGNYKLRKARKGSAVNLSFQTRWNIRKTIEHFLPHCLRKLFKPYNKKYVMTTCVQNSSVVNIAISLIYGTMNSLRCFVSSFYYRNNSKRIQYSLQLVIQQNESFPGHNKARNLLLATQQRLYSLLHSRRMGSTFVDINDDYATPK